LNSELKVIEEDLGYYGLETTGNFSDPAVFDQFYSSQPYYDHLFSTVGSTCYSENGDLLKYVGTAAVVRDMVAIADSLETPSKLINYWGFSYGTGECRWDSCSWHSSLYLTPLSDWLLFC
jgi:hypothetical protein